MKDAVYNWIKMIGEYFIDKRLVTALIILLIPSLGYNLYGLVSEPAQEHISQPTIVHVETEKAPEKLPEYALEGHTHDEYALKHTHKCDCELDELIRQNDNRR